jgi:DNA-binding MarR family transcriptional regulator
MDKNQGNNGFSQPMHPATHLLREVIECSQDYARTVGAALDVNETDFSAMEFLITNGTVTAGELAKAVGISPGSATVMIDRLVEVGHVSREPNPNDRRGVLVRPNPESVQKAWEHISPLVLASEDALSSFAPSERAAIEKYLATMLEVYRPASS